MCHSRIFLVGLAIFSIEGYSPLVHSAEDWKQRLLSEGMSSWKSLEDAGRRLEVVGTRTIIRKARTADEVVSRTKWEFKFRDACMLGIDTELPVQERKEGERRVRCVNPRYAFLLQQEAGEPMHIVSLGHEQVRRSAEQSLEARGLLFAAAPWFGFDAPLTRLFQDPACNVVAVKPFTRDGIHYAKVDYRYEPTQGDMKMHHQGSVVLDIDHHWRTSEIDVTVSRPPASPSPVRCHVTIQYGEDRDGQPVPQKRIMTTDRGGAGPPGEDLFEYDLYEYRLIPESDFALPAFGFPEFGASGSVRLRLALTLGTALTVCGVVSYLIYRASSRRRKEVSDLHQASSC